MGKCHLPGEVQTKHLGSVLSSDPGDPDLVEGGKHHAPKYSGRKTILTGYSNSVTISRIAMMVDPKSDGE